MIQSLLAVVSFGGWPLHGHLLYIEKCVQTILVGTVLETIFRREITVIENHGI